MIDNDWVEIFIAREVYQVELAKQKLEDNGIEAVVINKHDSAVVSHGEAILYVQKENEIKAREILA